MVFLLLDWRELFVVVVLWKTFIVLEILLQSLIILVSWCLLSRNVRSLQFLSKKHIKVKLLEKSMIFDILYSINEISKSLWLIMSTEMLYKTLSIFIKVFWESKLLICDHLEDLIRIIGHEWWSSIKAFINENTQRIPVYRLVIALI